jgi:hypothetical protein
VVPVGVRDDHVIDAGCRNTTFGRVTFDADGRGDGLEVCVHGLD